MLGSHALWIQVKAASSSSDSSTAVYVEATSSRSGGSADFEDVNDKPSIRRKVHTSCHTHTVLFVRLSPRRTTKLALFGTVHIMRQRPKSGLRMRDLGDSTSVGPRRCHQHTDRDHDPKLLCEQAGRGESLLTCLEQLLATHAAYIGNTATLLQVGRCLVHATTQVQPHSYLLS